MNFKATALRSFRYGKWEAKGARQGRYKSEDNYYGVMQFGTIRSVNWSEQDISEISIKLYFDSVGNGGKKYIGLYRGAKDAISGSGSSMLGAGIGTFLTNGKAHNSARNGVVTNVFSPYSSSAIFNNLVDWLKKGSTNTLAIYRGDAAGDPYSDSYLSITSAALDIVYAASGSTGTLNDSSVEAGSEITFTITPMDGAVGALTHRVKWQFGDQEVTHYLGSNLSDRFTIPMEWLEVIPNATSGTATCTLFTIEGGVEKEGRAYEFSIIAPAAAAPTFISNKAPTSGKKSNITGYYQHIGQAMLSITDVVCKYGATPVSYSITGGEGEAGTGASLTTGYFREPGPHVYSLSVTDSRGMTTTETVTVDVIAVSVPQITQFSVQRYSEVTDGETTQHVATDYGDHVWITAQGTWDTAGGNNSITAYIEYYPVGGTARATTRVDLPADGGKLNYMNNRAVISAAIPVDSAYAFELYFGDLANSASSADSVAKGRCNVHYAGSGYGACFGGFAKGTEENPMLESWYPFYAYEGIDGVNIYSAGEIDTGGKWVDGKTIYRRVISTSITTANAGQVVLAPSLEFNPETFIRMDAFLHRSGSPGFISPPYFNSTSDRFVISYDGTNGLAIRAGTTGSVIIILEYTKAIGGA